jgi:probable HAF family extracellular repeat protein
MKSKMLTYIAATTISAVLLVPMRLIAQDNSVKFSQTTSYSVISLGSLGGTSCCLVVEVNNRGWVDGTSNLAGDQSFHPFLWIAGQMTDLGTLGGPNASVGGLNERGDVTVGGSDTGIPDPLGEDFCGFGTHQVCLSYVWHNGERTLVPTLGGNNNDVATINNQGQVLAYAETAFHDTTCIAPQILGFEGFIWEPKKQQIQVLPPLPGNSASVGFDMNENGQVVGISGTCGILSFSAGPFDATLWQNGTPSDLGNLGGTIGAIAFGINNVGQVVGVSELPGDMSFHSFVWQNGVMIDLGTLPGDFLSSASGINDDGAIAGQSCDINFNCRAVVWQNGAITDLNTLIPANSPLFLINANSVNARGQIVGTAFDQSTGATVPFLATPCDEKQGCGNGGHDAEITDDHSRTPLPDNVRQQLRHRRGLSRFAHAVPTQPRRKAEE